jgi:acyl transferase domain-containing protein
MSSSELYLPAESIAIIGMSGRFPGARNLDEFWQNLRDGVESISRFSEEEIKLAGVDPALLKVPGYVNAGAVLEDIDLFDALFFGYSARDAESIDPQQRLFLECAWESLENAGCDPETYPGLIGVFGGSDMSSYLFQIYANTDVLSHAYGGMTVIGNDKDYLTTQVSYKLNLRGPSIAVQTSCSTSLVAVSMACHSLLSYQCDIALAGGVAVGVPQKKGYFYQPGGIASPDGHCRTFDATGEGTVVGNGVGIVVLKRLSEALADGDYIHAVIKGAALNNDGSAKVGYTAPSIEGQAQAIAMAQAMAGVNPETITYIEAHGTATILGDPIEIAALSQAFNSRTNKRSFCAIGSVKSNVGHLASAAGVAGLIKTVLALRHRQLPPSLHFTQPNPRIDFANSPFYVNSQLSAWKSDGNPRRAGVSSFGVGGTNAHVVLEEAPPIQASGPSRPYHLLVLSAKTSTALEAVTDNLVEYLKQHATLNLADVAYCSQVGRKALSHRRMIVCPQAAHEDAARALEKRDPQQVFTAFSESRDRPVVLMFSGQGTQYVDMALQLYRVEPTFREQVDLCCELLKPHLGFDLRQVLYPDAEQREEATRRLRQTALTQPALFTIEYALAKLWMEWGVYPKGLIGHSIGEYVAACLAGVFSLEDALALVAIRGHLMEQMPSGTMLAVPLSELEVQPLVSEHLCLAAVNGAALCVLSGPTDAIDQLAGQLAGKGIQCRRLHTSHAFHSSMMDPIVRPFIQKLQTINLRPPQLPYLSNVTGTWITAEAAMAPSYWGNHLRQTVRFGDGLQELLNVPDLILLEVGPGQTLSTFARQQAGKAAEQVVLSTLRSAQDQQSDVVFLLNTLGQIWLHGGPVHWPGFYAHERRQRVPLPTYPFERQRYWIGPSERPVSISVDEVSITSDRNIADWFYIPSWRPDVPSAMSPSGDQDQIETSWLVFSDTCGIGAQLVRRQEENGQKVTTVVIGDRFTRLDAQTYTIRPHHRDDYEALLKDLRAQTRSPETIVHLWGVTPTDQQPSETESFERYQTLGFYSLVFLAQALEKQNFTAPIQIGVVSNQIQAVIGDEPLCPAKATVLGACKAIPQEFPNIKCRSIDITLHESGNPQEEGWSDRLIAELTVEPFESIVAYRQGLRWVQTFEPVQLGERVGDSPRLRKGGVYLITGGLGNIGLALAESLAQTVQAKLVLTGRTAFPARDHWEQWLATHTEDDVSRKIRRLVKIEEYGAEVMVCSADSADREQMQQTVNQAYQRFGGIHGIIHGAGNTALDGFPTIIQTDRTTGEQHFRPKAQGAFVLEELFRGKELDFCLLLSSLSGVLGGLGLLAYSAANIFLDAFANQQNQAKSVPWISVNWDAWKFPAQEGLYRGVASNWTDFILPHEGIEAFQRILDSDSPPRQIVVSTSDLQARLNKWINLESLRKTQQRQPESVASLHARPNLSSHYAPPRTQVEQTIAEVWQEILGVTPIGIYDNFFELGGHSLLAIQLISRIREAFHVELPPQRLFEAPTIAQLAESIETDLQAAQQDEEQQDEETMAEMLRFVEGLSESEVAELLVQQRASAEEEAAHD